MSARRKLVASWLSGALLVAGLASSASASAPAKEHAWSAGSVTTQSISRIPERLRRPDPDEAWLSAMNHWRAGSRLPLVTENPSWTEGIALHLRYINKTPQQYFTGEYANLHRENPDSPFYTADGAAAGSSSNLAFGTPPSQITAMEQWMAAPFHAIGILRPELVSSAFAQDSLGTAGLDVIRGLTGTNERTKPTLWPGDGASTQLALFTGESPDPLETCGWEEGGLPLVVLLPEPPVKGTTARMTDERGRPLDVCTVTADNFTSSDTIYGPTGKAILAADNAVLVIPKDGLNLSRYTASIRQPGLASITWSFYRAGYLGDRLQGASTTPISTSPSPGETWPAQIRIGRPSANGALAVYPCGQPTSITKKITLKKGQNVKADLKATSGVNGDVCVRTTVAVDLAWYRKASSKADASRTLFFDSRKD